MALKDHLATEQSYYSNHWIRNTVSLCTGHWIKEPVYALCVNWTRHFKRL